jgi:RsiW-degrading membrane proteinase PrsW (M82 family)
MIIIRPFDNVKDNLIEIFNELIYLALCGLMLYYNKENRWNESIEAVFITLIISSTIFTTIVMLIVMVIHLYTELRRKNYTL